ncbi:ovarian tumor protease [Verticillium dahliae chrysovirus 1]|uniref:Ovarian tumor protease n=1 Tax=Verticillium dahliae chrysovirus 1 TaxID=759389 RepID=D6QSQ6_9VIRU|nr:ovarian tumor protease [Verticillium dahliae chrysovirus 1]ADG21216.1 ovarian tumor protease [Verticillium dahliae chrysovirus 1]
MSAYKRVMDYMSSAPDSANHIRLWEAATMDKMRSKVSGLELERKSLSPGERAIIESLDCQAKFTRGGMVEGITLGAIVDARSDKGDKIPRVRKIKIDFMSDRVWHLAPAVAQVDYVTRDPAFYTLDTNMKDRIISQCPSLSASQLHELRVDAVKDALSMPVDMRHLFMKMALMPWDYTLAATSKVQGMEMAADLFDCRHPNAPADARMALMSSTRVVIDAEGFSRRELGLIQLAAQQYPSVWYAGDNMYTACSMDADDVAIVSDGQIDMDTSGMWGSPDTLYQLIWSVAAKMDSVKCLVEALTVMRGKCRHMHDLVGRVGSVSVYSGVPLSICKSRGMGQTGPPAIVTQAPGYYSSSIALIADYLYGSMFEISATSVAEEVGGTGDKICGAAVASDRLYNGLLRDVGLRHEDGSVNILIKNWCSLTGSPVCWGYGGCLKDYIVALTVEMRAGWDVAIPQLVTLIPFMDTKLGAWGHSRHYRGRPDTFNADESRERSETLAVGAWLMGYRGSRPKLFRNSSAKESRNQTAAERELAAEAGSGLVIGQCRFWIEDSLGGREDELEEASGVLFKSSFPNVKCQLMYDTTTEQWALPQEEKDYTKIVKQTTYGYKPETELAPMISGPAPNNRNDMFESVKAIAKAKPIRPYKGPRPDISATGLTYVPDYVIEGEVASTMLPLRSRAPELGGLTFKSIDVPGDGRCGLHAILEDLKSHGMISQRDSSLVMQRLDSTTAAPSFHSPDDLAGAVIKMGLGLDVITDGQPHSYGTSTNHRVLLRLKDHRYTPIVESAGGEKEVIVAKHGPNPSDADYIKRLGEFEQMIGPA